MNVRKLWWQTKCHMLSSAQCRHVSLGDAGPVVSFTFDDFPRTALMAGGRILESYGARGTYYAAPILMGGNGEEGDLYVREDLGSLLRDGHELGSHSFSHVSTRAVPLNAFREDVSKGRSALSELASADASNFAYPFGEVTLASKKALEPVIRSARGICPGINGPQIDLNLLRAVRIYGDSAALPPLLSWIEQTVRQRGWIIFYTHDVRSNPSPYGCTPELLELVVSAAVRSGARIQTVAQLLNQVQSDTSTRSGEAQKEPLPAQAKTG